DFTQLSLQELLDVQVTSVSRHAEPLRHAAAAITVVTGDELRRTGARTLAQGLRLVPGLQVVRTNAHSYTVTSRGFSGDKLEVLLDGRSVYSPLTSTVFWDVLDTSLNDVDRIEVIRGPGGTLWGANAVNGVINIVTRHSQDTAGNVLRAGGGVEEKAYAAFRGGSKIGETGHARFFAKALERDASVQRSGVDSFDSQRLALAGFRSDWALAPAHALQVSADFHHGREDTEDLDPNVYARGEDTRLSGASLLARWVHQRPGGGEFSLQAYYDGYRRDVPDVFADRRDTGDLQVQHRFAFAPLAATVTWGGGYRATHDETGGPPRAIIFDPASRTLETFSLFVQGQRALGEGGELTVGSKFEHNDFTGFEAQPGVRLGWALGERGFTWAAVSRAVRLPNRLDQDVAIFCEPPIDVILGCTPGTTVRIGSPDFDSEKLIAYEWGLRAWTDRDLTVDLTTFYNTYTDLRSTESSPPPIGSFENKIEADSYGAELALGWAPRPWIRVRPFYSYLHIDAQADADSTDANTPRNLEGGSPRHSAGLHLGLTPRPNVTVDAFLRHVGELERQQVPDYTELNLRLGWKPLSALEVALVGADLLDDSHAEAGSAPSNSNPSPGPPAVELERAVWLDLTWSWQ
ncbi:MAG: TonB-dependent receptor plug domain-containing protein, partial [Nevskiaceae bacterium]